MADKPSYEELENRVAALEARERLLAAVQADLKRSLNFTESLLASLPTPVFWKDARGRYQGCNAAFTDIMGVTPDQMREHPHALFGSVDTVCEELERRRELHGISYVTVGENAMDAFAPVVARLAGK